MSQFVGVLQLTDFEGQFIQPLPSLKREALFFDRIATPGLGAVFSRPDLDEAFAADLQWLMEKEIIWEPPVSTKDLGRPPILTWYRPLMTMVVDVGATARLWLAQRGFEAVTLVNSHGDLAQRFQLDLSPLDQMMSDQMERLAAAANVGMAQGAFSTDGKIMPFGGASQTQAPAPRLPGIELLINEFPEPDDDTPWEEIEEFRADPESRERLRDFRRWIGKVGREGLAGPEAAEELRYVLANYEKHLHLHEMKTSVGLWEGLLVGSLSFVENLAKLKLGELAKLPFAAKRRRLERLEAELSAPGREIAYVAKARQHFGHR